MIPLGKIPARVWILVAFALIIHRPQAPCGMILDWVILLRRAILPTKHAAKPVRRTSSGHDKLNNDLFRTKMVLNND